MVLDGPHIAESLEISMEKWYNKTIKSGPPQNGEGVKTMSELKRKKTLTAREKALRSLVADIGERCANDEEMLKKAVKEAMELAQLKTENGEKNPKAWAHTIPAIRNHIFITYKLEEVKEEDLMAVAMAAAAKQKKKNKKVEG